MARKHTAGAVSPEGAGMRRSLALALASCLTVPLLLARGGEPLKRYTETLTTKRGQKLSFEMVFIPGGKFAMGSPDIEPGRKPHEGPQHEVEIKPFYLCATETTWDLYFDYCDHVVDLRKRGDNGRGDPVKEAEEARNPAVDAITTATPHAHFVDITNGWGGGKRPAMQVTWYSAMNFCKWLSKTTGKRYRLPTEAEWEHACRAGAATRYFFGDDPEKLGDYAWFDDNCASDSGEQMTHPVGEKKPNPWGLYDMLGNVCEWVVDFYSPTAYAESARSRPAIAPEGPAKGKVHVARGGHYDSPAADLRCAARAFEEPWWSREDPKEPKSKWFLPKRTFIGFRVAREIEEKR